MAFYKVIAIIGFAALAYSASIGTDETEDECVCTREYNPICASDNVTYNNECLFECEKRHNYDLSIKFYGDCADKAAEECICTQEYVPVCGSDDITYASECFLDCQKLRDSELTLKHNGECETDHQVPVELA